MSRKFIFISFSILSCLLYSQQCFGLTTPEQLTLADNYMKAKDYVAAETAYKAVIAANPDVNTALFAQKGLAVLYVETTKETLAQDALSKLTTDFAGNIHLPETVFIVAKKYEGMKNYPRAKDVYQLIIQKYSTAKTVGNVPTYQKAQVSIARLDIVALIDSGNITGAQNTTNKMINDFSSNPALPSVLYYVGDRYERAKKFAEAKDIYQKLIQKYPNNSYSAKAKFAILKNSLTTYANLRQNSQARATLNELIQNFPQNPALPDVLLDVGRIYDRLKDYEQANYFYQQIINRYPNSSCFAKAKLRISRNLLISKAGTNQLSDATAIDTLISESKDNSDTATGLHYVAKAYEDKGRYQDAKAVYQKIVTNFPQSSFAAQSRADIQKADILTLIESGNYAEAEQAITKMKSDFSGRQELYSALSVIGESYYRKGVRDPNLPNSLLNKSLLIYEKDILPNVSIDSKKVIAYYMIGLNCQKLGDYTKAAQAFKNAYQADLKFQYADYLLFAQGYCYEILLEEGKISEQDAKSTISAQYSQLISKYPQSQYVKHAQTWLSEH